MKQAQRRHVPQNLEHSAYINVYIREEQLARSLIMTLQLIVKTNCLLKGASLISLIRVGYNHMLEKFEMLMKVQNDSSNTKPKFQGLIIYSCLSIVGRIFYPDVFYKGKGKTSLHRMLGCGLITLFLNRLLFLLWTERLSLSVLLTHACAHAHTHTHTC